jgi:surface protein
MNGLTTTNTTDMSEMYSGCNNLETLKISEFDTSNVTDTSDMFNSCWTLTSIDVSGFNTSKVTDMSNMFYECDSVLSLDTSKFNTANVYNMSGMFDGCYSLTKIDLSSFNTTNVTDMSYMFNMEYYQYDNTKVNVFDKTSQITTLDISTLNTSNVENMDSMFRGLVNLTSLDITKLDTAKVVNMEKLFSGLRKVTVLDTTNFKTSNVTSMAGMFYNCNGLTEIDVRHLDTSKVKVFSGMFGKCENVKVINVNSIETKSAEYYNGYYDNATDFEYIGMFQDCTSLKTIYNDIDFITDGTYSTDMFINCNVVVGGNGTEYDPDNIAGNYAVVDNYVHKGYFTSPLKKDTYQLTIINNGVEEVVGNYETNEVVTLPLNDTTISGKVFTGWATTSTSTEPEYADGGSFVMPSENTTLYAVWSYQTAMSYYTEFKYSEPWGLKFSFALLNPKTNTIIDNANYDNYGIYVMTMDSEDTDTPSVSEVVTQGTLYSDDNSNFTKTSVEYNDTDSEYLTLTYDKDIYTQNLADDIYVLTYVTYKGRTFYGTVKNRCVIDSINSIIDTGSVGLTSYDDSQVQLAKAIKKMYSAEKKYYLSNSSNTSYPKGSNVNTTSFDTVTSDNTVSFAHSTALRAIAPWGLKLQASPTNVSNYDSYGCIVYTDTKNKFKETPTASDIISCDGAVNYSSTDNTATLEKISGKNFITAYAVGDIYTYQLASTNVYTVFYYVKDGKYYYDNVQQRNCMDMANIGIETSSGTLAGDVYSAMINLYNETYYYRNGEYPATVKNN